MTQNRLSNLFLDQSKDLIWMVDIEFQLLYANTTYLNLMKEMYGVEKKLNESVFLEGLGEEYTEKWKAYYNRALTGAYFEIEEHYHHPVTNEIQYTQVTFEPLTDDDHNFFAVVCVSKDIKRVVKERSEANQMVDASLAIFCTINEQGNFVYVSAAAANHWGYAIDELIGKPYLDMVLEDDVSKTIEVAATVFAGHELQSFVNRYKKKNGDIAYNLWSVKWDDTAKLLYCVAIDGKEKIEQEEKILQSEKRFKALVQEGSDLIAIIDEAGNYIYVSPTSTAILGMKSKEFIGRNALEFIHPEDAETTLASLRKITVQNRIMVKPFRFLNHKKEWRWIESVFTNMLDNPAIKGIIVNSRDITDKIEEKHKLKLLESVITNTNDAILITEAKPLDPLLIPIIIYVNEAFTRMTGYTADELMGKSPRILQGPKSDKKELNRLSKALLNWESCEITIINYKKNGEEFWVNFTMTPVADEKGCYTHWISIERDVTEQKLATERIQKVLEEKIRILESIGDAFFALDNDGIVTYWNNQAELILGRKKEQLLGKYLWDVYEHATDSEFFSQFHKTMETREATNFEAYSPILNIWLEVSGYPSEEGLSVYFKDVTLRKEAAMKLQQANERFERVTEATNDAIWDWDMINQTHYRSKAIKRFFGKDALTSRSSNELWKDNFHPEDLPKIKDSIYEAIANPSCTRWELEYRVFNGEGKMLYVIDRGLIIRNNEGAAIRMVGAMTDITEQKQMQIQEEKLMEDIVQRNKNLEQFSYIISHNLRSPVANILGLIALLHEENIPTETMDYINNSINLSANKLDEMIKDLNDILQVKNNVTETKELVSFRNLASDIYASIETLVKKENAIITWDFTEAQEMMTIKSYLHSIFYNLVSNSLKYRQRHVPLSIEIKSQLINNKIVLLFKDNGLGIDLEKQNNMVFGLYKRFHANYAEGKGVGLFMVKTQVETIGGSISIKSEVNKGTEFRIEFPV